RANTHLVGHEAPGVRNNEVRGHRERRRVLVRLRGRRGSDGCRRPGPRRLRLRAGSGDPQNGSYEQPCPCRSDLHPHPPYPFEALAVRVASLLQATTGAIRYAQSVEPWSADRVWAQIESLSRAQPGGVLAMDADGTLWSGDVGD